VTPAQVATSSGSAGINEFANDLYGGHGSSSWAVIWERGKEVNRSLPTVCPDADRIVKEAWVVRVEGLTSVEEIKINIENIRLAQVWPQCPYA
jgi:hypothetical protein